MKRMLKTFVIIVGSGFLIFLLLNTLLNKFLSEERLKAMLIEPAQKELGRQVTIGSLEVSLLRGITIKDIAVKEGDSNQDFISVDTFRLSYELLPLLQKKLVIKEVLIDKPEIRIVRNNEGQFNFADIVQQQQQEKKEELVPIDDNSAIDPLPISLTFDLVNINKAVLTLTDKTNALPEVHSETDLTMSVILGKTLTDTTYRGSFTLLANSNYHGHKPVLQIACSITEKLISYTGNLTLGFDKIEVNGKATNYLSTPEIELNANINNIDLDELASLKQFINDSAEQKPPNSPQPDRQKNPAQIEKEVPTNLKLSAYGKVNIGEISKSQLKLREIKLNYRIKDNVLALDEIDALIFGGSIKGNVSADNSKKQPAFQGKIAGQEIKAGEIMTAFDKSVDLSGELATNLSFQGTGKEWSVIRENLNADGRFTLADGGMKSTPITMALASLLNIPELNDLQFRDFSGNFTIADGNVSLDSNLQNDNINLLAKGIVGLDGGLNMPLTLQLSPEYGKQLDNNATFTKYLADEQGHTTLYLKAKGSVQKPKLTLNSQGIKKQASKVIEKKIMEELGRVITKSQSTTSTTDKKDPVKDAQKMLFKQLMGN